MLWYNVSVCSSHGLPANGTFLKLCFFRYLHLSSIISNLWRLSGGGFWSLCFTVLGNLDIFILTLTFIRTQWTSASPCCLMWPEYGPSVLIHSLHLSQLHVFIYFTLYISVATFFFSVLQACFWLYLSKEYKVSSFFLVGLVHGACWVRDVWCVATYTLSGHSSMWMSECLFLTRHIRRKAFPYLFRCFSSLNLEYISESNNILHLTVTFTATNANLILTF